MCTLTKCNFIITEQMPHVYKDISTRNDLLQTLIISTIITVFVLIMQILIYAKHKSSVFKMKVKLSSFLCLHHEGI